MKNIIIVILLLIIASCNSGMDISTLSGNSLYMNDGGHRQIYSNNAILHRTTIYPTVITHAFNKDFILAKQKPSKSDYITYLGFDLYGRYTTYSNYLKDPDAYVKDGFKEKIMKDSLNYEMFKAKETSLENNSEDIQISQSIAAYLLENDPSYQKVFVNDTNYWIIYNPKDTLIGPMTREEYLIKRKEFNVPDNLQLNE